jgi:hypothetical protein
VDRRAAIAILGPNECFGHVGISIVAFSPLTIKVHLHAPRPPLAHLLLYRMLPNKI